MNGTDDEDVLLQRASGYLLDNLKSSLPRLLWKSSQKDPSQRQIHRWANIRSMACIITYIEPFQEDPQLLDTSLKQVIPQLVTAYLEYLPVAPTKASGIGLVTLQHAICCLLYQFCKARGEKIVTAFLNNEPRYLEPILEAFEASTQTDLADEDRQSGLGATWEEKYILLLWLSHLMLAPFDLASISSQSLAIKADTSIILPPNTPGIAAHIIPMCTQQMQAPSKERDAAALLLVRLSLRPDMRKIGLLDAVIKWALSSSSSSSLDGVEIHRQLGIFSFLSRLVASANTDEIGSYISAIYRNCQAVVNNDDLKPIRASAIVRKFIIKIFRNLIVLCLQWDSAAVDTNTMLEEVIEYLLVALADTDTPVRYAASKALSVITLKLDNQMAAEIVDALLGSFEEDVWRDNGIRNLSAVNPLRWHGLALTLGHVLYRQIPAPNHLPKLINTLLMALNFEQRSTTGTSIGTNVRDAACFGIWALSRRYKTSDLAGVDTSEISSLAHTNCLPGLEFGTTQMLAIELLVSACLDPAGNIRRGSSAALQELIGRHPDTVKDGISLVQVVDYHVVALRNRAIEVVGLKAAKLDNMYLTALLVGAQGWRGLGAVDAASRQSAASLIGSLTVAMGYLEVAALSQSLVDRLKNIPPRDTEQRHGVLFAITEVINNTTKRYKPDDGDEDGDYPGMFRINSPITSLHFQEMVFHFWLLPRPEFGLNRSQLTEMTLRPELTSLALCAFITAISQFTFQLHREVPVDMNCVPMDWILETFQLCMRRTEDSVHNPLAGAVYHFSRLLSEPRRIKLSEKWLQLLATSPNINSRPAGLLFALGAICNSLAPFSSAHMNVVKALAARCTTDFRVEVRVTALQALQLRFKGHYTGTMSTTTAAQNALLKEKQSLLSKAVFGALNDYTITERGDVGSLVRIEALKLVDVALYEEVIEGENAHGIHATVVRLAMEKLDKVRNLAFNTLFSVDYDMVWHPRPEIGSEYDHFKYMLGNFWNQHKWYRTAVLEGFVSSAGMGSESVLQAARQALIDHLKQHNGRSEFTWGHTRFCGELLDVFHAHIGNDRIVLPLLEVLTFMFDAGILTHPNNEGFKWRKLFSLVQKSHFRSTLLQKLLPAIAVYRGLAVIDVTRVDVLNKLCSMLLHPFPKVRIAAAEALFVLTELDSLKTGDWSRDTKTLKPTVERIKTELAGL